MKTTFSRIQRETDTMQSVFVHVDGITVAELLRDPTASAAEWYTHASGVRLTDGTYIEIPDQDWGRTLREARMFIAADIRGQLASATRAWLRERRIRRAELATQ